MKKARKFKSLITNRELSLILNCSNQNILQAIQNPGINKNPFLWFPRLKIGIGGIYFKGIYYWSLEDVQNLLEIKAEWRVEANERKKKRRGRKDEGEKI